MSQALTMENTEISTPVQSQNPIAKVAAMAPALTPMDMLNAAVSSGAGLEVVDKLMDLQERWEKNNARKAFDAAMADAKSEIPTILKNRTVQFSSRREGSAGTHYRHEDLAEIARTIDPVLGKYGLSYRFRVSSEINQPISVTCVVSHRDGYSEETVLRAGRDDSGNKNSIQQIGSTITYLQRYTLKAALGLAASNEDDGRAADDAGSQPYEPPAGSITQQQADEIRDLLESRSVNRSAFLQWVKRDRIEDIPQENFENCIKTINKSRGTQQ